MRVFAASSIVLAGICLVLAVYIVGLTNKDAAKRDFISYWSAGQLLVRGSNPYDFHAVKALEVGAGRQPSEHVLIMRNPPFAFFVVLPLGFTGPKAGLIAWLFTLIGATLLASFLIWRLHGSPDSRIHLLGFFFAPVLACLMAGQFGIFLLLGVVLFLYSHHDRPFLAGASLLLCALKPHFFAPFGVALLLSPAVLKRGYSILAGFCAAVGASCALAYTLDPQAWGQYAQMMREGGALNEVIPELSAQLRLLTVPRFAWIQFVPEVAASLWAGWYFWTRRSSWDWIDHGMVLLLVGALCTPFGWLTDESMLLPAALAGLYRASASHRRVWPLAAFGAAALAELMMGVAIVSRGYLWTTPAWLCWYLYASGRIGRKLKSATG